MNIIIRKKTWLIGMVLASSLPACATRYYLSPTGNDANSGLTARQALASFKAVQAVVEAGDTVWIMTGTYTPSENDVMAEENAGKTGQYKIVNHFTVSGEAGRPICYIGQTDKEGNRPVFDFSQVKPSGWRVTAFLISADYLLFRNFEVTGLQVNRTDHTQSENVRITNGSYNTFENIACHDGMGIGFYLTRHSAYNLFLNCDGYHNYDPVSDIDEKTGMGSGGNNDGFGCHVSEEAPGNLFVGCRAWNNADDGYDLISCASAASFCYCIAYRNGYDAENKSRGDGNGFKAGGFGMDAEAVKLPGGKAPMHEVCHSIAASNKANGFYSNHHLGGVWFHDNTAYRNTKFNYSFVNRQDATITGNTDVNGYGHQVERNLSMVSDGKDNHVTALRADEGGNVIEGNSFYWISKNSGGWAYTAFGNSIFESTKVANLLLPRKADGLLAEETLAVMRQKSYLGLGCSFDDYEAAVADAKTRAGALAGSEATGVSNVYAGRRFDADVLYDLQGRKVRQAAKGIYIKNGKKTIVR